MLNLFNDSQSGVASLSSLPVRTITIDLSNKISGREIPLSGKNFTVDKTSSGFASIDVATLSVGVIDRIAPFVATGGAYFRGEFQSLKLSCEAQPGCKLVLIIGDFYFRDGAPVYPALGNPSVDALSGSRAILNNTSVGTISVGVNNVFSEINLFGIGDYDVCELLSAGISFVLTNPAGSFVLPPIITLVSPQVPSLAVQTNLIVQQILAPNIYSMRAEILFPIPLTIVRVSGAQIPSVRFQTSAGDSLNTISINSRSYINAVLRKT